MSFDEPTNGPVLSTHLGPQTGIPSALRRKDKPWLAWHCSRGNPFFAPRMHYVGYAELAAAVSNAGGLGTENLQFIAIRI